MPGTGVEPAREYKSHYHLKVACLPIPPPRLTCREILPNKYLKDNWYYCSNFNESNTFNAISYDALGVSLKIY